MSKRPALNWVRNQMYKTMRMVACLVLSKIPKFIWVPSVDLCSHFLTMRSAYQALFTELLRSNPAVSQNPSKLVWGMRSKLLLPLLFGYLTAKKIFLNRQELREPLVSRSSIRPIVLGRANAHLPVIHAFSSVRVLFVCLFVFFFHWHLKYPHTSLSFSADCVSFLICLCILSFFGLLTILPFASWKGVGLYANEVFRECVPGLSYYSFI